MANKKPSTTNPKLEENEYRLKTLEAKFEETKTNMDGKYAQITQEIETIRQMMAEGKNTRKRFLAEKEEEIELVKGVLDKLLKNNSEVP